jgi:hypothetical protein
VELIMLKCKPTKNLDEGVQLGTAVGAAVFVAVMVQWLLVPYVKREIFGPVAVMVAQSQV